MKWIIPTAEDVSKPDEEVSKDIANQLLVPEIGVGHQGYILDGFPFNVRQALMLDRFIKGVNLAIYIRTQDKTREDSLSELLDYYDQRVTPKNSSGQPADLVLHPRAHQAPSTQTLESNRRQHQDIVTQLEQRINSLHSINTAQ